MTSATWCVLVRCANAGADITNAKRESAGDLLAEEILKLMERLNVPNGLQGLGYDSSYLDKLVEGTLPQKRVTGLSPNPAGADEFHKLFEEGMSVY